MSDLIRGVPGSKIARSRTGLNVYLMKYFDPFIGRTKYCVEVLAPFKRTVKEIALDLNCFTIFGCDHR